MSLKILGIESSCDDTSAAVLCDTLMYSNVINTQRIHEDYGGVVPELASRAHQQNIVLVVQEAISQSGFTLEEIDLIAFTKGPGLLGSLLVGTSFAKGLALATGKPILGVNHLHGHLLAHMLREKNQEPFKAKFPYLCLLVSGGHTQIVLVKDYLKFEILGKTIDDAAGEAFDKCARVLGLSYPGGPEIDKLAKSGRRDAFLFNKPRILDLDFSFSGLKTSFLYSLRDNLKQNPTFIEENIEDLAASLQNTIVEILLEKLQKAVKLTGVTEIAVSGGVSANSGLRKSLTELACSKKWKLHLPELKFTTDNAAMIALIGHFMYISGEFSDLDVLPKARLNFTEF
jgi:N6-L-threonylcarbamoyladenine synthase